MDKLSAIKYKNRIFESLRIEAKVNRINRHNTFFTSKKCRLLTLVKDRLLSPGNPIPKLISLDKNVKWPMHAYHTLPIKTRNLHQIQLPLDISILISNHVYHTRIKTRTIYINCINYGKLYTQIQNTDFPSPWKLKLQISGKKK